MVVWSGSAQAAFVRERGVGLVLEKISDLPQAMAALTEGEYAQMAYRAGEVGAELRAGSRLIGALKSIEQR